MNPRLRSRYPLQPTSLGLTIGQIVKGQRETIAAYDPSDHIRVFDEAGKEEWKSAERYGGSTLHFLGNIDDPRGKPSGRFICPCASWP